MECCYWASAHNVGLRELRNSQPVNQCYPLIQPPLSLFPGQVCSPHGPQRRWCRAISWVPGVLSLLLLLLLLLLSRHAARREGTGR